MKKYVIAAAIMAMLSVGAQNVYAADEAVNETKGFKVAGFMESEIEENTAENGTDDRTFIKRISTNESGGWNGYLTQKRNEYLAANEKLRIDKQHKMDMTDLKNEYKEEKNAINHEYALYKSKQKTESKLNKNELKNQQKIADLEQKMELEQQKWAHEQSVNKLKIEQQLKHRFYLLGQDKAFTYYMDLMNTRWVRIPYRSDEYMIDTWIRLVENSEVEKSGDQPAKYYLEHYYMNDDKKAIQFLCEMEVSDGYPDNTVNQRKYKPNQWEGLVPGSIEDELYHRVVNNVKALNIVPGKDSRKKTFWDILELSDDDMDKALKSVEDAAFIWNLKKLVEIIRI